MEFRTLQQYLFLGLLGFITLFFLWVINDYLIAVFWAIVFGIIFAPLHRKMLPYLKFQWLSSVITIFVVLIIIIVPTFFVGSMVIKESVSIYDGVRVSEETNSPISILNRLDSLVPYFERFGIEGSAVKEKAVTYIGASTNWLADQALSFGGKTFTVGIQFFIMIYVLFFLLKDGEAIKKRLMEVIPLGDKREEKLIAKFTSTTRAVIKGTLVVGIVQGFLGGLLFSFVGVSGAVLWGVLMTILSVVPAVGAFIVWAPAGIIMIATGSVWEGVTILIVGAVAISLIDNILRPILVGKDTKMPDVLILLSTLGGISIFGVVGFVIGPIVAGFFIAMWEMFEEEYQKDLKRYG